MSVISGVDVWPTVSRLARQSKRRRAAVACLGSGAFDLLTMGRDDVLVVDCSPKNAKAGLTDPFEVGRYLAAGVAVYRRPQLHAKVYVFDKTAIVGSANASQRSAKHLTEAVLVSTAPADVKGAREFIEGLLIPGAEIDAQYLKACKQAWRPPKFDSEGPTQDAWTPIPVGVTWQMRFICTYAEDFPQYVSNAIASRHKTVRAIRPGKYSLDTIEWERPRLHADDVVVEVFTDENGKVSIHPPARVEESWVVRRGKSQRVLVTLQRPTGLRAKSLTAFQAAAGKLAPTLPTTTDSRTIKDPAQRDAVLEVWGLTNGVDSDQR